MDGSQKFHGPRKLFLLNGRPLTAKYMVSMRVLQAIERLKRQLIGMKASENSWRRKHRINYE